MITTKRTVQPDGSYVDVTEGQPHDSIELSVNAKGTVQATVKAYFSADTSDLEAQSRISCLMDAAEGSIAFNGLLSAAQRAGSAE